MNYIKITVREKRAKCNGRERIVCGNSDYVIKFDFDDEWAAYDTKTARFVYDGGKYTDVQFTGDEVGVPVLRDTRTVSVGCYAGDIHTTTAALIQAVPCCTDPDGTPADPAPDVYNQLMERFDKMEAPEAVLYTEQELTDEQKKQARVNIGANGITITGANGAMSEADYNAIKSELEGAQNISLAHNRDVIQMQYWEMTGANSYALFFETTVISSGGGIVRKSYEVDISPSTIATTEHIMPASDTSLGLTSAAVGQTIKVKSVDDSGKPTAWEAVDMASGGSRETWELINTSAVPAETTKLTITQDLAGKPFAYDELKYVIQVAVPSDKQDATIWFSCQPKTARNASVRINGTTTNQVIVGYASSLGGFAGGGNSLTIQPDVFSYGFADTVSISKLTMYQMYASRASLYLPEGTKVSLFGRGK